jgi:hypothetical protein
MVEPTLPDMPARGRACKLSAGKWFEVNKRTLYFKVYAQVLSEKAYTIHCDRVQSGA